MFSKIIDPALIAECERRTNSTGSPIGEETEARIAAAYYACRTVFETELDMLVGIYVFDDSEPDAFVLETSRGNALAISTELSKARFMELKICLLVSLSDAVLYGPEKELDVCSLRETD